MCKYWEDENVKNMGEEVLYEHEEEFKKIIENSIRIGWILTDKEKKSRGRYTHAECKKVPEEWKWCCKYDFLIIVYHPNVQHMDTDQLHTLLWHELKHIRVEEGLLYPKLSIRPHDMEDFKEIIEQKGINWDMEKGG